MLNIPGGKAKNEKKEERKIHCRVLLSKKTPFPFSNKFMHQRKKFYFDERELLDVSDIS